MPGYVGDLPGGEHPAGAPRGGAAPPAEVLPADRLAGGESPTPGLSPQTGLQWEVQALAGVRGGRSPVKH